MADIVYFNGEYLDRDQVRISPNDRGWLLADGVYEAAPAYRGRFLRLDRHLDRLASSAAKIRIEGADQGELAGVPMELVARNGLAAEPRTLAYFQITRGAAPRTHAFPNPKVRPTVYAYVNPFRLKVAPELGAAAITRPDVRWGRCDIKSIALLANVLANQEAQEAGVYETLFVRDGSVQEGTHTNVFAVTDGVIRTPPLSHFVLPGITREILLDLIRELGLPIREEPIGASNLATADEVFLTGTTTEVMPVVRLDGRPVGSGKPGPVTQRLGRRFAELVTVKEAEISNA